MKRLLLLLLFATPVFAQGTPYENFLMTANGPSGSLVPVIFATVTVCAGVHTEVPCTPAVPIYSDVGLTQVITPPLTSGPLGNYRFVVAPGTYSVSFTGPGINVANDVIVIPSNTGQTTTGQFNGYFYVDGVQYTNLNAAFTACNTSAQCNLTIPPGSFSFSTQISPTHMAIIQGAGASYQNAGAHCNTTLTWTGGNTSPFLISGPAATGTQLKNFCLNVTGTAPPALIDVDNFADKVRLEGVFADNIDGGHVAATVAALRIGPTTEVDDFTCQDSTFRASGPVEMILLKSGGQTEIHHCRFLDDLGFGGVTPAWEVQVGGTVAGQFALNVNFVQSSIENDNDNAVGVEILNGENIAFSDGSYFEQQNTNSFSAECPSTAQLCQNISFYSSRFSFVDASGHNNNSTYAVHVNKANATFNIFGSEVIGLAANPNYLVKNDASASIAAYGNNLSTTGGVVATSFTNVNHCGNTVANALVACSQSSTIQFNHSGTATTQAHSVIDTAAFTTGTVTITLTGAAVFTSGTTYVCSANDRTTPANAITVTLTSGSSITFTGTGSDAFTYRCAGY